MLSIIYFLIFCVSSTISALPPPSAVYSAVIHNAQDSQIQCQVIWLAPKPEQLEKDSITIETNDYQIIKEKLLDMGTWTARGTIEKIRCGHLVLTAPFPNVHRIETAWEFRVEPNRIVSVGPSSHASDD